MKSIKVIERVHIRGQCKQMKYLKQGTLLLLPYLELKVQKLQLMTLELFSVINRMRLLFVLHTQEGRSLLLSDSPSQFIV